jgi:lauroyl/myristoyl acyltransferase
VIRCLGRWLSAYLSRRGDLAFIQALRANLTVVHGLPEEHPRVRQAVALLLENTIASYADLFRMLKSGTEEGRVVCELDPEMKRAIEGCLATGRGLILVGAHMCSFDILLLGLKQIFPAVQILSNADPQGSSQFMNRLRVEQGLLVTPLSVGSLRQALPDRLQAIGQRLRQGGIVAIAADVPVEGGEPLIFFGRSSQLPVGHTRLAMPDRLQAIGHRVPGTRWRVTPGRRRHLPRRSGPGSPAGEQRQPEAGRRPLGAGFAAPDGRVHPPLAA